jgi:hypothetical protein
MIDHRRARILQATAFDFDLSPEERRPLEDHLAGCAECLLFGERLRADQRAAMSRPLRSLPATVSDVVRSAAVKSTAFASPAVPASVRPRALARPPLGGLAWLIVVIVIGATGLAVAGSYRESLDRNSPQATDSSALVATPQSLYPALPSSPGGALEPGTYLIDPSVGITITVPRGWNGGAVVVSKPGPGLAGQHDPSLAFTTIDNVYADACHWEKGQLDPKLGPSIDDLAAALVAQRQGQSIVLDDVVIGGYAGKSVETTIPDEASDCTYGFYRTWLYAPDPASTWPAARQFQGDEMEFPGRHDRLWILDIRGVRVVIFATDYPDTPAADRVELQQVIDSIRIDGRA